MSQRKIVYGGVLLVLIGGVAICILLLQHSKSAAKQTDKNGAISAVVSQVQNCVSRAKWFKGAIVIQGQNIPLEYRRLKKPIRIGPDWKWSGHAEIGDGPLDTVLKFYSCNMKGASVSDKEYYSLYAYPKDIKHALKKQLKHEHLHSLQEFNAYSKKAQGIILILGEIKVPPYTLIVNQTNSGNASKAFYDCDTVRKFGNKYLLTPMATQRGTKTSYVLQKLSADEYSLVTKEPK